MKSGLNHEIFLHALHKAISKVYGLYLQLILKGLRLLDPSGVVLEQVCSPVREYLRTRDDTVRCIVASLTDDSNNELADVSVYGWATDTVLGWVRLLGCLKLGRGWEGCLWVFQGGCECDPG